MHPLRASPVFALAVLVTLGLFGFIGVVLFQPNFIAGLLGQETAGHISGHFRSSDLSTTASTTSRSRSSSGRP